MDMYLCLQNQEFGEQDSGGKVRQQDESCHSAQRLLKSESFSLL